MVQNNIRLMCLLYDMMLFFSELWPWFAMFLGLEFVCGSRSIALLAETRIQHAYRIIEAASVELVSSFNIISTFQICSGCHCMRTNRLTAWKYEKKGGSSHIHSWLMLVTKRWCVTQDSLSPAYAYDTHICTLHTQPRAHPRPHHFGAHTHDHPSETICLLGSCNNNKRKSTLRKAGVLLAHL